MKVIVVDPDTGRRRRIVSVLRGGGHEVLDFSEGPGALRHPSAADHEVIVVHESADAGGGVGAFDRARSKNAAIRSYLISIGGTGRSAVRSTGDDPGAAFGDDRLSEGFRAVDLLDRMRVAREVLNRRREEAIQVQRIVQIPAESPLPILELSSAGSLVHANLAGVRWLESVGWRGGRQLPAGLRRMAARLASNGEDVETEWGCGTRTYSFRGIRLVDGGVCLYGHEVAGRGPTVPRAAGTPGRAVGLEPRDALTGLPTRALVGVRTAEVLARARAARTRVALVKVNIDNCADINDAYGHRSGDRVIEWVAECLRRGVRTGDAVFRDSGDGFVLLLAGVEDREAAGMVCHRFLRRARAASRRGGLDVRFTLSMGMALFPDDADDEGRLIERAEVALAEAKSAGRNCWRDFPTAVGANPMIGSEGLLPKLLAALQARRLEAHYQPIVSAATGRVVGFEALVRWHDPELGWIPPDRFIPLAEARGLISEIGRLMADAAFGQLAAWRRAGHRIRVSLNLSKPQLMEANLATDLRRLAGRHRVSPSWIILEVTERQALLHDPVCRETMARLAKAGFRLSLDDFGSGHSTFDAVADIQFRELKIDTALGRSARTPRGRRVVRAILAMGRDLGLECVVEGIEDAILGGIARRLGATRLQGYLYSPPLSSEDGTAFLAVRNGTTRRSAPRVRGRGTPIAAGGVR